MRVNPYANKALLDAQLRMGADTGAGVVVSGPLASHAHSVVIPFLLPDISMLAWWQDIAPTMSCQDSLNKLAIQCTTNSIEPLLVIKSRLPGYTASDTDLAWALITYWRALLNSAVNLSPHEPIDSALISGLKTEPTLDALACWINGPVRRAVANLKVELIRNRETIFISRPQTWATSTLVRTAKPDALVPLARRETGEFLVEDLRRLDPDEIYFKALEGIEKVQYL